MNVPDTLDQTVARLLERVRHGARTLGSEALELIDDPERCAFRRAAQAGAEAYAEHLATALEGGHISHDLTAQAELVGRAAHLGGWLSVSAVQSVDSELQAMYALEEQGVFAYYPAVPQRWVACYRLVG